LDGDQFKKPFSSKTNELIDEEVKNLITRCYDRAIALVEEKRDVVEKLAQRLLEKETIVLKDLHEILGKRPYDLGEDMNNYMEISNDHQNIVKDQNLKHEQDQEAKAKIDTETKDDSEIPKSKNLDDIIKNSTH